MDKLTHSPRVEKEIRELGLRLFSSMRGKSPSLFDSRFWQGKLMEVALKDPSFKVDLFRFIDVFPTLRDPQEISSHLAEYLLKKDRRLPRLFGMALKAARFKLTAPLAAKSIQANMTRLAQGFILGETPAEALGALKKMDAKGVGFSVDLLGEAVFSEDEAASYRARYLELVDSLRGQLLTWPENPRLEQSPQGRGNLSLKVSAFAPHLDAADLKGSVKRLYAALLPVLLQAKEGGLFVNLDLEQWSLHTITYALFKEILLSAEFRSYPKLGIVVQAYHHSAPEDVRQLLAWAEQRGCPLSVRLVKGAYWDFEVLNAGLRGYPLPLWTQKGESDCRFEALSLELLRHHQILRPAFASHNLRSLAHLLTHARIAGLKPGDYEIQLLTGMAEPLREALLQEGELIRLYCPVGGLVPGLSYLVRRLLENTSSQGFISQSLQKEIEPELLFCPPEVNSAPSPSPGEWKNCPELDFTDPAICEGFAQAVGQVKSSLPILVGAANRKERFTRLSPNDPKLIVTQAYLAGEQEVIEAVQRAAQAFPSWRDTPLEARVQALERLADLLEKDRFALAALQCFEVAKPWREADGDVAEAIDFCRYYAQAARTELAPRGLGDLAGEENQQEFIGRGPAAIIAPWNFPLAILTGMATAALVAGNPVLLKPSRNSLALGQVLHGKMLEAGIPPEVAQFLPISGERAGKLLARAKEIALIAFTGSKEVGLSLWHQAAQTEPGQREIKKMICELGGKNAIIIDEDADMDEAVSGVLQSAWSYGGQKCSAADRVIVVGRAKDQFIPRLIAAAQCLRLAPAWDPACQVPPMIDSFAQERLLRLLDNPPPGVKELYRGQAPEKGYFVPPAIFQTKEPNHPFMQEEFFGPLLTLCPVKDFDQALEVAMNTGYALTGSLYSRLPSHLERAKKEFLVGNLYLNKGSTGAKVGRQPFGGHGFSGAGTQAGGPGYLSHFVFPRLWSENLMRRGFSPKLL